MVQLYLDKWKAINTLMKSHMLGRNFNSLVINFQWCHGTTLHILKSWKIGINNELIQLLTSSWSSLPGIITDCEIVVYFHILQKNSKVVSSHSPWHFKQAISPLQSRSCFSHKSTVGNEDFCIYAKGLHHNYHSLVDF